MAEALRIEDLYKKTRDISSCGEGLKKERTVREEEAKSSATLGLVEKVNILKRQLKVAEEDRQRQAMIQKNLEAKLTAEKESHEAKLEETTVGLKNNYNILLSDRDYFLDELAATKKSAQTEALKVLELEQKVTMMADKLRQQAKTTDALHSKLQHLEEEREMLLEFIQQMPFREEETPSKSVENFLLPTKSYRSRQEETKLPVAENSGGVAEVTTVKKRGKKKTKGFRWKRFLCCFVN